LSWRTGDLTLEVVQGDLTKQDVDAIVNAANNDLELGGGVAGAIARAGGPTIQAECRSIGRIEVGDAAITAGGDLAARYVIHAASMHLGGRTSADSLRRSTRRSLELARERSLQSIAFPAVGTGIARFPLQECAQIMVEEVIAHSRDATTIRQVRFVLFDEDAQSAFRQEVDRQLVPAE
jgi:O-acetyl-ADP-ribose deacetylase (regulator of RNase III)